MRKFLRKSRPVLRLSLSSSPDGSSWKMLASTLLICAASPSAMAYEPPRARAGMAQEAAECAAYFMTAWQAPDVDSGTKDRLRQDAQSLIELSGKLTSEKLARTRARLSSRAMLLEIGNDWGKVSMLDNRYQYSCRGMVSDPSARMQYWSNKPD